MGNSYDKLVNHGRRNLLLHLFFFNVILNEVKNLDEILRRYLRMTDYKLLTIVYSLNASSYCAAILPMIILRL